MIILGPLITEQNDMSIFREFEEFICGKNRNMEMRRKKEKSGEVGKKMYAALLALRRR